MVVGVAHLVAKRDVHNSAFMDVVAHLARFHPTKVLVEADASDPTYAQLYRDYLNGEWALRPNEVYQFGFRLAARAETRRFTRGRSHGGPI